MYYHMASFRVSVVSEDGTKDRQRNSYRQVFIFLCWKMLTLQITQVLCRLRSLLIHAGLAYCDFV